MSYSLSIPERLNLYLERRRWLLLALITVLYFAGTLAVASSRPLWFDEIFTAYLARLGSTTQLWSALAEATDVTPPLFNLITRTSVLVFGPTELALRLPAVAGFWLMGLCIFVFVRKRASILYAAAALLIPICIEAGVYASEARPYGLVLGGCGLALACWQAAADGSRRWAAIPGLALALAFTTSCHYYGALFLFPLAAGEFVRTLERRKVDWMIWSAFCAVPLTLLGHLSWIRLAMTYSGGAWSMGGLGSLSATYSVILGSYAPVAFAGVALTAGMMISSRAKGLPVFTTTTSWETTAIAATIALPLLVLVVSRVTNGIFAYRYALPAVIGCAVAIAVVPLRTRHQTAALGLGYFAVFSISFVGLETWHMRHYFRSNEPSKAAQLTRVLQGSPQAVAIADAHQYLQLAYYAPQELRSRLYFVASPQEARRLMHFDDDDRSLLLLRHWAPLNVSEYEPFLRKNLTFGLYGRPTEGWLLAKCLEEQVPVTADKLIGENMLMLVNSKSPLAGNLALGRDDN
ncbi:MAG: glycosyltransferase family 39 protein [Bryobacteraceae bacterium]